MEQLLIRQIPKCSALLRQFFELLFLDLRSHYLRFQHLYLSQHNFDKLEPVNHPNLFQEQGENCLNILHKNHDHKLYNDVLVLEVQTFSHKFDIAM